MKTRKNSFGNCFYSTLAMIAEIGYGYFTNSMALLADGYHMGTHTLALGLTYAAC